MIANWLKAVWILLGATVAAVGAAYVTGVFEPGPDKPMVEAAVQQTPDQTLAAKQTDVAAPDAAAETAPDAAMSAKDKPKAEGGDDQMASLEPQDKAGAAATAESGVVVPAFDLVRVEPDGSVVIAGTAAAGSSVEVVSGATVIGNATAGDNGDFAVVLNDPLAPGDYTIVLRSSGPGDLVATSAQTAIISVPETEAGQVLALVEEPGAPSRLITVPTAKTPANAAKGDRPKAAEPERKEAVASVEEPKTAPAAKPAAPATPEMAATDDSAPPPQDVAKAEEPAAPATVEAAPAAPEPMETAKADEPDAEAQKPADQPMAAVEAPKPTKPAPTAAKPAAPKIAVEAVEIEGRKIFVAGFAEPGSTVRVYANDILLGQTGVSAAGRFLIEAEKDLPVGDYIVRADMLGKDKAEVLARAAVPFEREPGEKVAAVAAPLPKPAEAAMDDPAPKGVETAMADSAQKPAGSTAAQDAAPRPDQTADAKPSPDAGSAEPKADADELAGGNAITGGAKSGNGNMAATSTDEEASPTKPAAEMAMTEKAPANDMMAGGSESAAEPASGLAASDEILSPKLQNVGGAVIIRRGDTLWRLSRRVYGRGIRYTTIYLANEDQISDPDLIWPGQVFSVPGETKEGESADMSAVAEQTTDPDDVVTR